MPEGTGCMSCCLQEDALSEQLDALPFLVRFQYERSAAYLNSLMDPRVEAFKQASAQAAGRRPQAAGGFHASMQPCTHVTAHRHETRRRGTPKHR